MIIKSKIFAAGHRSLSRIPRLAKRMEEYCHGGKITVLSGLEAFADNEFFTLASRDTSFVFWTAMAFLEDLHDAYGKIVANDEVNCDSAAQCKQDEICEKRMDDGRYVFARATVTAVREGVSINLRVENPFDVVGESEIEAREYSIVCAQIFLRVAASRPGITVTADDYIMARAKSLNDHADLRKIASLCKSRVNGFCTPINPHCPCYKDGRCCYGG